MAKGITVTEHILAKQKERPEATGAFTAVLAELTTAAKIIARRVSRANLTENFGIGGAEDERSFQKLAEFANSTIIDRVSHIGHLWRMASKTNAELIRIPPQYSQGNYILIFDPLGGITNIDVHVTVGTIFSILKKREDVDMSVMANVLQPGDNQVAAGYFIYGSSTMMVYTTGSGVHGFTLDPAIGEFLLSHQDIRIPEKGKTYGVNEGNYYFWEEKIQNLVEYFKTPDIKTGRPYRLRYTGSFVADFHRNLLKGGIHMYPADSRDSATPFGKLMLLCEANPLAFVVEQAGGMATTGTERILSIEPQHLHQRSPVFIGSPADVRVAEEIIQNKR